MENLGFMGEMISSRLPWSLPNSLAVILPEHSKEKDKKLQTVKFKIGDIKCTSCVVSIEFVLRKVDGVENVAISVLLKRNDEPYQQFESHGTDEIEVIDDQHMQDLHRDDIAAELNHSILRNKNSVEEENLIEDSLEGDDDGDTMIDYLDDDTSSSTSDDDEIEM